MPLFASAKQLASFQGTLICATSVGFNKNLMAPVSLLTWTSKKIARVVRSTLPAEAFSMSGSVDRLGWMRLLWGILKITNSCWRDPIQGFQSLPSATIVADCKKLYDLVSRTAMPSCEEFRTTLEVLLIRERCQDVSSGGFQLHFRWQMLSLNPWILCCFVRCWPQVSFNSMMRMNPWRKMPTRSKRCAG